MNAVIKVVIGALMIVLGVYSSVTFWNELVTLVKAGIGPLLILVGAFIVWLETDELKMEREQKKETKEKQGLQREFQPEQAVSGDSNDSTVQKDYSDVLSGNVEEAKNTVREMADPDFKAILEAEKRGKDRKTLKDFLERRID